MLQALLPYRTGIGLVLGTIAATVTVVIFQSYFEINAVVSVLTGILAYVSALMVWMRFTDGLASGSRNE
jgi:hypothetical protein